ncbi:MAG: YHS domain-containing protein [Deltaproteobacteria bacterium]|nr:YHS domain-containing protein [Deltaproteobacteria bacterium]MBW2015665.1 YHS domain-containing protein [Deltaproteobacteria bacterium]MBW2128613.1 YHS domain-containing protein [Deltaproteobacteria bacterium]MBW2304746.1 YHS domain-containing protein [Deltaproteobacteria bacterium]
MTDHNSTNGGSTNKAIDPVCRMEVEPGLTKFVSVYQGRSYWFCAEACRKAFEANPRKYLHNNTPRKKGWFGRYLQRIAKVSQKEFGGEGPRCH